MNLGRKIMMLRNFWLVIILTAVVCKSISGATYLSFQGGPGLATMNTSVKFGNFMQYSRTVGWYSTGLRFDVTRWIGLRSGIEIVQKGYFRNLSTDSLRLGSEISSYSYELKAKRDFLQIPLLLHICPPIECRFRPFVEAGQSVAININAKDNLILTTTRNHIVWEYGIPDAEEENDVEVKVIDIRTKNKKDVRLIDLPLTLSVGGKLKARNTEFCFGFRCDMGLLSYVKNENGDKDIRYRIDPDELDTNEFKSFEERYNLLAFSFGLIIPLGVK